MSKDIRSYFTVLTSTKHQSKTSTPLSASKKRPKAIESSDEDVIPETPTPKKKPDKSFKKRKVQAFSSDSEEEKSPKNKEQTRKDTKKETKNALKPITTLEAFGSDPVKQAKVPERPKVVAKPVEKVTSKPKGKRSKKQNGLNTEIGIHNDIGFEKTLLELDDDFLMENVDELDKTIEEALNNKKNVEDSTAKSNIVLEKNESPQIKNKSVKQTKKTPKKKDTDSSEDTKTPNRKRTIEDSGIDPDQERYERKRHSAILFQKYKNRSGPAHHGSKEVPKGKPDCLKNVCFIRTGVLDSLESEEFEALVKEHGGRTVHSISKKVNYVVAGEDPGPAKLEKANNLQIKIISEDEFLDLIRIKSGMEPVYVKNDESVAATEDNQLDKKHKESDLKQTKSSIDKKSDRSPKKSNSKKAHEENFVPESKLPNKGTQLEEIKKSSIVKTNTETTPSTSIKSDLLSTQPTTKALKENLSWTDKYKPTNIKAIIGQQGDKSNMKRLMTWLQNWYKNHSGKNKPKLTKPSPWATNDDGGYFKAALLSGPPGVGKTTTANLVAQELGFDVVEFNASDTRSKRLLHEEVSQLLSTKSLAGFFADGSAPTSKHVLLMDEVDGMAGNEDRGGMQELISLIKNSSVPIICMCNDRNHQKMRSLANYCVDLRFSRPRLEQIKGAMMSVCFKEGVKITPEALTEIINSAGMDIRQILTNLSMWSAGEKSLSSNNISNEAKVAKKDTPLGPWEVCRKVFSEDEHKTMSIGDRSRLFYHDYSLAPLFVQENYVKVMPHAPKKEHLARFAAAADAISMGDMIDTKIRRTNNWSLLDVEAMCASVLPGYYVEGHMNGQIDFPGWLGKNSKKNKFGRLVSELQAHMRTSISGSRRAVNLDYITHLRNKIVRPLAKDGTAGINEALEVMHTYNLLREDLDSILELAQWPRQKDPMNMVDSKVKAAFTRAYNKEGTRLPYAVQAIPVKKKTSATNQNEQFGEEDDDVESSHEDEDDVTKDAMIKAKKTSTRSTKKETEPSTTTKRSGKKAQSGGKKMKK